MFGARVDNWLLRRVPSNRPTSNTGFEFVNFFACTFVIEFQGSLLSTILQTSIKKSSYSLVQKLLTLSIRPGIKCQVYTENLLPRPMIYARFRFENYALLG
jgi:hypothetical protein